MQSTRQPVLSQTLCFIVQVVFATPGMLHAGLSLQIFKKWAPNENNMVDALLSTLVYSTVLQSEVWSKWGSLGEGIILNPERFHSFLCLRVPNWTPTPTPSFLNKETGDQNPPPPQTL